MKILFSYIGIHLLLKHVQSSVWKRKQNYIVVILTSLLLLKAKWSTFLGTTTQVAAKSDMQVWTHAHSYLSSLMVVMMMMMMVDDVK